MEIYETQLSNKSKNRYALFIHLMYMLGMKTWELWLLRYENFEYKNQLEIKIYDPKKEFL